MSKLKPGTQGFIKVTEEPCFILDVREGNAVQKFPGLSGQVAVVRRPIAGDQGVRHDIDFFTVEEVESIEDNQRRKIQEMAEMRANFEATGKAEPVTATSELPKWD